MLAVLARTFIGWRFAYLLPSLLVAAAAAVVYFKLRLPTGIDVRVTHAGRQMHDDV